MHSSIPARDPQSVVRGSKLEWQLSQEQQLNQSVMNEPVELGIQLSLDGLMFLLDALAIAKWVVCSAGESDDAQYRCGIERLVQSIYRQVWEMGFTDEVWRCKQDGTLEHSSFEDEHGKAWQAVQNYNEESFWLEFIDRLSSVLAEREARQKGLNPDSVPEELQERKELLIREVLERHGLNGLTLLAPQSTG